MLSPITTSTTVLLTQESGLAFTQDGKLVGTLVIRKNPVQDIHKMTQDIIQVILPASTIADVAKQAPQVTTQTPDATK